ncbi:MAG: HD domain-containing phosphohydrolase [Actinomycetota bacterium]
MTREKVKGRYGLRGQFLIVLLVAVLFLTVLLVVGELIVPDWLVQRAGDNTAGLAAVAAGRVSQALRQNASAMERLAALPGIVTMDPAQQTPVMALAEATNPEIKEMFVIDANGVIIAATPEHPSYAAGRNFSNAEYFRKPMEMGKPFFSDVFIEGRDVQIVVSAPIKQADGTHSGTLNSVLSMSAGVVAEYLKNLDIGQSGYAVLVDRRGSLVWHPDETRVVKQENIRGFVAVKNVVAGETGSETGGLGGEGTIAGYVPVKATGLGLLIVRPIEEALPDLLLMRLVVVSIYVIGILLAVLMFWHGSGVVLKPIRMITEGLDQASAGQYDVEIEVKKPREMAELAASFNQLVRLTVTSNDVSRTLNSLADISEIEKYVLNKMDRIFQTEASAIVRFNEQGQLRIHASRGFPAERVDAHNLLNTGLDGMIYMFGQDAVTKLSKGDRVLLETDQVKALKTIAPEGEIKYIYLFPLLVAKKLDGVLMALSSSETPFTEESVNIVSGLVDQVSAAVHRSDLYERLYQSYAQTTKAISRAIDAKDPYKQGHSEGVAEIAVKIAKKMGLSVDAVHGVEIAAYLHDVGKIGLSEDLLNKPAQLSEEEKEQIRQHPGLGVSILEPIDFPWPVLGAVGHHHERFDGEGYPDSLAGDKIPLEGRILAVADAYESMVSDRPYRSALETDDIVKEFTKESGRQFDSGAVSALLGVIQDEIKEEPSAAEAISQEPLDGLPEVATVEVSEEEQGQEISFESAEAHEALEDEPAEGQDILPLTEKADE